MFLNRRALQAEYFDSPARTPAEVAQGYAMLNHMNRLFLLTEPYRRYLPKLLGPERCRSLDFLDLGAGDGWLGQELSRWAARRGWFWRFTNLDLNPWASSGNPSGRFVTGSALSLPFCDRSFDIVIASQMAHHLDTDDQVSCHFKEAWRVTRDVLFLNDLHRNAALYTVVWLLLQLHPFPQHFRTDGTLSVLRSWRVLEWRSLAARAGIPDAHIWLYYGSRVMLLARKESP
jgi:2-polyprenyl-3-methyl-5-hydroxy-6-metoxy-1,4-benzoquinol methylase